MAKFTDAPELMELARKIILTREEVYHVDVREILFLKEHDEVGRVSAKCFNIIKHPIQLFTEKRFAIVFYESNIDYYTYKQRAILMFHELMHIPAMGDKLVDHNIKDFYEVLLLGVDWNMPGANAPDILGDIYEETKKTC